MVNTDSHVILDLLFVLPQVFLAFPYFSEWLVTVAPPIAVFDVEGVSGYVCNNLNVK